jgi:hypothetical protein
VLVNTARLRKIAETAVGPNRDISLPVQALGQQRVQG